MRKHVSTRSDHPNPRLCKALIDRLTDRAHIITTGTDSYWFRRTTAQRRTKS